MFTAGHVEDYLRVMEKDGLSPSRALGRGAALEAGGRTCQCSTPSEEGQVGPRLTAPDGFGMEREEDGRLGLGRLALGHR